MELTNELFDDWTHRAKSAAGIHGPRAKLAMSAEAILSLIAAARRGLPPEPLSDLDKRVGHVSHDEAELLAMAYIDKAFNNPENPGRRVRHSIPANPREDSDLRLMAYIRQQRAQRGLETEAARWVPVLDSEGLVQCDEGQPYLFAIQMAGGGWEMFVNRLVWDSETEPYWGDDDPGWEPGYGMFFTALPSPPEAK